MKSFVAILSFALLSTACFKTAEQIRREKQMDNMGSQIDQSGHLVAKLTQQVNELQTKLNAFNGQIEELGHNQQMSLNEHLTTLGGNIRSLDEQVKALRLESEENKKHIQNLEKELQDNKAYIQKVNATLSSLSQPQASSKKKVTDVQAAHTAFEKSDMKTAENLYLQVLEDGKINAAQRNHVWFNLGLINYNKKAYEESLVYFSKIYAGYPQSSWAPRALLYMARSLGHLKKNNESKGAYQEIIKKFPDSPHAKTAKEEMK